MEIDWFRLEMDIAYVAEQVKKSKIGYTCIYGIPKNGLIVALILSQRLGIPVVSEPGISKYCLIVDDIIDSGATIKSFIETGRDVAVLYNKNGKVKPKYWAKFLPCEWVKLPFEKENDAEDSVRRLLECIGEDTTREGLKDTPKRVAKFYKEWFGQGTEDIPATCFSEKYDNMVVVKDIPFYSMCEHHMLPFIGKMHIGYVPDGKVIGLSKVVRIAQKYSHRLQIQERIGKQIADELEEATRCKGIMVVIEAEHLCMSMRGIRSPGTKTVTSEMRGLFESKTTRNEFLELIK